MRKLLKFMKGYRKEAVLGPFFKLTEAIFELLVPLVVADIIDNGIANKDVKYIVIRTAIMALLGLIGFLCAITAQYFAAKASIGFASKIRVSLFEKIQKFTFTDLDKIGTSTLITRLTNDINQVQTGVNLTLRLLLRSPFIVFGAMIMAFTVDTVSALIFVVAIPILAVIVVSIMAVTVPIYKKVQLHLDKILLKTRENLKGVRVIRAFCKENDEIDEFDNENTVLTKLQNKVGNISALMNPLTYVIVNAAVIAIIWVGGIRVNDGSLSQGSIVAIYNYMSQILIELVKLANMIITLNKSLACADRIGKVMYAPITNDTLNSSDSKSGCFIEFKDVCFKYNGAAENSLSNISFAVNAGETVGIIGPTGSGKSTLVNLLPNFYSSTDGSVLINGVNVKSIPKNELKRIVSVVMQKNVLFKGTVRDNLLLGGKTASDDDLKLALSRAQILDIIESKGGLDAVIEQGGRNLSGGQKQRLCIARALVGEPEILILDDSSSALDFATEAKLRKEITNLPFNPTVFIVSQRVPSIMHADKIVVLDDGEAVGIGTHKELIENCDIYKNICSTQLQKEDM